MYGLWERPHRSRRSSWIYADASVHRLISDLAVFVGQQGGQGVLAAGDLNILHRYGENGSVYWGARYATVFERMRAMGIPFVGPQAPHGRCAEPWPTELPSESVNVPTYHTTRMTPAQASRQLMILAATSDGGAVASCSNATSASVSSSRRQASSRRAMFQQIRFRLEFASDCDRAMVSVLAFLAGC